MITQASPFDTRNEDLAYNYHLPELQSDMSKRIIAGNLYASESAEPQSSPYRSGYDGRRSDPDVYSAEGHRGKLD